MDNFMQPLLALATEKTVAKNDFLLSEGQVERYIYVVRTGAVRVFLLTEFEELTIRFGYEHNIITSLSSFLTGSPSAFYIQAIRRSKIASINKSDFELFVRQSPAHLEFYNELLENLVVQQMEREIDLLTPSPTERLKRVLARSPQLFQEIPLKYIASYLRMTPETLSRIRNS